MISIDNLLIKRLFIIISLLVAILVILKIWNIVSYELFEKLMGTLTVIGIFIGFKCLINE